MALLGDYHTHTKYSRGNHAKGTIEDNVRAAYDKGLRQIAISDHGFNQKLYGVRRNDIPKVKEEINDAMERYPIEVLLGVEANLISSQGDIDIIPEDYDNLDIVLCGFHRFVRSTSKREQFSFILKNIMCEIFHHTSKKQREKNTNAYINAMRKYDIDIITHLNHACKVDVEKVARVAKETDTLIELNGKRLGMSDAEIMKCYELGCKFVIDSDAHSPQRVGECHLGLEAALRLRIPDSAIVNYNSLPTFKKEKRKKRS
ncbi:MAG: PHP domain-containing protein [Clostridiales bacterium]|nr:PHP domain-containing protein [Clostridiales bacterium]